MSMPNPLATKRVLQKSNATNDVDRTTTVDSDSNDMDEDWVGKKPTVKRVIGTRKKAAKDTVEKIVKPSRAATKNRYSTPPKSISVASSVYTTESDTPDIDVTSASTRSTSSSLRSSANSYQILDKSADSTIPPDADSSFRPQRHGEGQKRLRRRVVSISEGSSDQSDIDQQEDEVLASLARLSVGSVLKENHLSDALRVCDQSTPHDFATFIDTHRIAFSSATTKSAKKYGGSSASGNCFEKLGEASYSEVFGVYSASSSSLDKVPEAVMKVVPLALKPSNKPSRRSANSDTRSEDGDEPMCLTEMRDIVKEIELTRLMNGIHDGFVNLRG